MVFQALAQGRGFCDATGAQWARSQLMRMAVLLIAAACSTASPCFAEGNHLLCPALVSETIGDKVTILEDALQLYVDEKGHRVVFEGSLLRRGTLSFRTTQFSRKLITADVSDKTAGAYFDAPARSGYLRLDRKKGLLVLGMYLQPTGTVIETAMCQQRARPIS
jgi:hypothetical protein